MFLSSRHTVCPYNRPHLRRAAARVQRVPLRVSAIGFAFEDREEAEAPDRRNRKKIASLGTLAGSMLVLAPVMRGSVADAFLSCLAAAQKYQASNKEVLAAYSKFYGLLMQAGYESWQDYLLDQTLLGRDNNLARAVAQGTVQEGAPVFDTLAHDLEILQALALGLDEVAEYIGEMAPIAGPDWVHAASSASLKRPAKRLASGEAPKVSALNLSNSSKFITRPPTQDELSQWKAVIANKDSWSEAVPILRQYWSLHGFGITSRNTALRWVKGALEEGPDPVAPNVPTVASPLATTNVWQPTISALEPLRATLASNTAHHCEGAPGAQHVLVAGPSGTGKSGLLWDSTLAAGRERGVRIVDVGADVGSILEAARGCGRYPRARFIVVADHVDLPLRGAAAADLLAGLSGTGAGSWPSNTLLYLGATATSTVANDPVVARFGLKLFTKHMTEGEYASTLKEVASAMTGQAPEEIPAEQLKSAVAFAQADGGLSVRAASMWLSRYLL